MPSTPTDHDMLIRLDQRAQEQTVILGEIKEFMKTAPCQANSVKIKNLERITYGTLLVSISAAVAAFWKQITGN